MITIHLGLPKTATTLMQSTLFPALDGVLYLSRRNEEGKALIKKMVPVIRSVELRRDERFEDAVQTLRQILDCERDVILSHEALSVNSKDFWAREGLGPDEFCKRISVLLQAAGVRERNLRFLFGVRSQSQWIASRYAQSALGTEGFSQTDFEARLNVINEYVHCASGYWLYFDKAVRAMSAISRSDGVFVLPLEALSVAPVDELNRLLDWLGYSVDRDKVINSVVKRGKHASRSVGQNAWKLAGSEDLIFLPELYQKSIKRLFCDSNRALAAIVEQDLDKLGYF